MAEFKEVPIESLQMNPFTKIGREWMLVTAGDESGYNTLTASWGGLGVLWGRNVATCYIRPQRYTKEFLDAAERFTLSFYDECYRDALTVLGTKSGRDGDKVAEVGFTPYFTDGTCAFEQANLVLVCRKIYTAQFDAEKFTVPGMADEVYPARDCSHMYIGEIERVLARA